MTINEQIAELKKQVEELMSKIQDLSANTEQKYKSPTSVVGGGRDRANIHSTDIDTGKGQEFGGSIIWNDSELVLPPANVEPPQPKKGYNKHTHSRYSGGALIKDGIEVVELEEGEVTNIHSQQFFVNSPNIKKDITSSGTQVEKIGVLDLIFNADAAKWGCPAYEIDVKKCYLIERDSEGNIAKDSKGQDKKSMLYNEDETKSAVVWDENAGCWRFYAVYASGE